MIITGEPGMGRTTILDRALEHADANHDRVVRLLPSGEHPYAALRASFPFLLPPSATLPDAVRAIAGYAGRRRLVGAADDAHLVDHASLLALRELSRQGRAMLLITRPLAAGPPDRPDPSECLTYEPGVQILILKPLSVGEVTAVLAKMAGGPVSQPTAEAVHAATGGSPQLLRALTAQARLTLALGLGRAEEASSLLSSAAEHGRSPHLMRAARVWLLAVTGQAAAAARELAALDRGHQGTAVFIHAARAALTRLSDRTETVFHLRRALAAAESCSDGFPWMRPYLKASLIDALLLGGRVTDAVSLARRFHAREPGAGWDLAVALNSLIGGEALEPHCSASA